MVAVVFRIHGNPEANLDKLGTVLQKMVALFGELPGFVSWSTSLYDPFGWTDAPMPPSDWVVKNRWTRAPGQGSAFGGRAGNH